MIDTFQLNENTLYNEPYLVLKLMNMLFHMDTWLATVNLLNHSEKLG